MIHLPWWAIMLIYFVISMVFPSDPGKAMKDIELYLRELEQQNSNGLVQAVPPKTRLRKPQVVSRRILAARR